ncbi:MAG: ADP-forming succinate--CoA ligase subunit beta [Alphaproteobacteria bacterium]|nr:ADP-forming succinate--CoA ligase subunit beta [Alphaproteobacteria bacterium]
MKLHEYQAKQILSHYGIKIPHGKVAYTPHEAKRVAGEVSARGPWVVKAQIQSGARPKGKFKEKSAGRGSGVRIVTSRRAVFNEAEEMLGATLVTPQTDKKGKIVTRVYVEAYQQVTQLFYVGFAVDRMTATITLLLANLETDSITDIISKRPETILRLPLDFEKGVTIKQTRQAAAFLELSEKRVAKLKKYIQGLFKVFVETDALMLEANPTGVSKRGDFIALDAKLTIDDKALYRQPDMIPLFDAYEVEERELRAAKNGFQYRALTGSIGCIVNGDGVALAAMDLIRSRGGETACFLNVKGGVDRDKIASGIKLIMTNPRVEGILINVLGGFLRCNLVADGIIAAASEVGLNVPLVVRFEGTNKDEAKQILETSRLPVIIAEDMQDSVEKLLQAMEEGD